jgi:hypothetical protein
LWRDRIRSHSGLVSKERRKHICLIVSNQIHKTHTTNHHKQNMTDTRV